jgi:hypothetical protein
MVALGAVVGTFLLAAAFYAATLHVAARWVLGATPLRQALLVGPVPAAAAVGLGLSDLPTVAVFAAAAVADAVAIVGVYRRSARETALLTAAHVVVAVALAVPLLNLYALLG